MHACRSTLEDPTYWKQTQHFGSWYGTPYRTADRFNTVFGVNPGWPATLTLLDALNAGGGGAKALGRHAVAALLNASNPNVSFLYSPSQVISMVQTAFATKDLESIKNVLEAQNQRSCELGLNPGTP